MTLAETEQFLHEQIPLSKAMGVKLESADAGGLILTAPLDVNHNHLGTAFGGSLGAVAVLAGYALLWRALNDRSAHIVVRSSKIEYRRPVRGEIRARCGFSRQTEFEAFKTGFLQKGKARIHLDVSIEEDGHVCVEFEGVYVAVR
jgi:thioesterase domain-containing protein